jgi:hypothetical protein
VAERELEINFALVLDVLWTRAYARAKQAYDGQSSLSPEARVMLLADPMVQQVKAMDFELAAEAMEAKKRG